MGIRRRRDSDREKTHGKRRVTGGEGTDKQRRDSQMELGLKTEKGLRLRRDSQTATVCWRRLSVVKGKTLLRRGKK